MLSEHKGRVLFANTLRGVAALSVLISHYFGVFWLARASTADFINAPLLAAETTSTPTYVTLLHHFIFFNWGAYGVALFFLISGFVIPFSLLRHDIKTFIINRFFRIVPTYLAGFTLTIVAIFLSGIYFDKPFPYHAMQIFIHYIPGLRDLLHSKSIDGIVWTLEMEIKFYIIAIFAARLLRNGSLKIFFIPLLLVGSALLVTSSLATTVSDTYALSHLQYGYFFVAHTLIFMFIGVIFHYAFRKLIHPMTAALLILLLFFIFTLKPSGIAFENIAQQEISYAAALSTFAFAFHYQALFRGNRLFNFLANISYPLYVIHGITGYVLLRILLDQGCNASLALLLTTTLALTIAFVLHRYIERPSQQLGRHLAETDSIKTTIIGV